MRRLTRPISTPRILALAFSVAAVCASAPAVTRDCDIDATPAATLLLPYFEVDVTDVTPPFPDIKEQTVFAVLNTTAQPVIAHVTLWTDWAIPTLSFDLRLSANDEQSINLIDVFTGTLPSSPAVTGCTGALQPGTRHYNPAFYLPSPEVLRQAHTGADMASSTGAKLVASSSHPGVAKGYVTVDTVRRCTDKFPSSPGYFESIAAGTNALVGDFFIADTVSGTGLGDPLVHIRWDAAFQDGNYTFYGAYVNAHATDHRQPLPNLFATRQFSSFPPNPDLQPATDLLVWRDCKSKVVTPIAVGSTPPCRLTLPKVLSCDEAEHCGLISASLPLATQRVGINVPGGISAPPNAGWLRINLNQSQVNPLFGRLSQGWIVTVQQASQQGNRYAAGLRAFRLQSPCSAGTGSTPRDE